MAFVNGIDVSVGDAILAAHVDNLADNTEFCRELADVQHDFDISTGDGYHNGAWSAPVIAKASSDVWASLWLDATLTTSIQWRTITGTSEAAVLPGGMTSGHVVVLS